MQMGNLGLQRLVFNLVPFHNFDQFAFKHLGVALLFQVFFFDLAEQFLQCFP